LAVQQLSAGCPLLSEWQLAMGARAAASVVSL
jgi:hypothetical protein